jgi:membrane protease YdiL (CAAX protease family)
MPVPDDETDALPPADAPEPSGLARPVPEPAGAPLAAPSFDSLEPSLWYLAAAGALYAGMLWLVYLTDVEILDRAENDPWAFLRLQALDDGLLVGVTLLFGRLRFPGSWAGLGFRPVPPRWWSIGAGAGLAAAVLAWLVSVALERAGAPVPPQPVESVLARADSVREVLLVLAAVTLPVAIGEESFFRGFAYCLLRARLGVGVAIVGSALIFALVHGLDPGAWLPILPVGIIFAIVVERSGSLAPAMVGHAVVNALAVLAGLAGW